LILHLVPCLYICKFPNCTTKHGYYGNKKIKLTTCSPLKINRPALMLVSCSDYFSTLKMEVICSSETSVCQRTTRRYIPEDDTLQNYRCENLKSYILKLILIEDFKSGHNKFCSSSQFYILNFETNSTFSLFLYFFGCSYIFVIHNMRKLCFVSANNGPPQLIKNFMGTKNSFLNLSVFESEYFRFYVHQRFDRCYDILRIIINLILWVS
jgi:hypothetical protein